MLSSEEYQESVKKVAQSTDCSYAFNTLPAPITVHRRRNNPYSLTTTKTLPDAVLWLHARQLSSFKCTIWFNNILNPESPASDSPGCNLYQELFLGQIPFLINRNGLQAVLEWLAGAKVVALRPHMRKDCPWQRDGTWSAWVRREDAERFTQWNKRVMFRPEGVDLFDDPRQLCQWMAVARQTILHFQQLYGFAQRKGLTAMVIEPRTSRQL